MLVVTNTSENKYNQPNSPNPMIALVTIQIVEYSNRRKNRSYSKRRKNSIAAIIFRLQFEEVSMFVVWLGRFAPFAK